MILKILILWEVKKLLKMMKEIMGIYYKFGI